MADVKKPLPVKYFIAVLYREISYLEKALYMFIDNWGNIDFNGKDHLFDVTSYYEPEMGRPLYRRLISLENLAEPTLLVNMKLECNNIEKNLSVNKKRTVNCDCGYLDHNKIVLASAKEAGQKIYIDKGIYADFIARYKEGKYRPFEWSFLDFKDGRYDEELLKIRNIYLQQRKLFQAIN
jgi:hypothetical protein